MDCQNFHLYVGPERAVTTQIDPLPQWHFHVVLAGGCDARYREGRTERHLAARAGDVILWPPGSVRFDTNLAQPRLRSVSIYFLWTGGPAGLPRLVADRQGYIRATAEAMLLAKGPVVPHRAAIWNGFVHGMLAEYVRLAGDATDELAGHVTRYVQEHLQESIRLADLARAVHLSPFHLEHRYKAATGRSVMADVRRIRAEHAVGVLRNAPGLTLRSVAEKVGLPNAPSLCRLLKRELGVTSREIRGTSA
ncbi:helix-turn-helix transcriptional regulator [bacterium]|nr:helix-turn-helix transcriptional regulator [bacterium]